MGKHVRVIGLDPGVTTGMAILDGNTGTKYSSGEWYAECQQHTLEELQAIGAEVAEGPWRDIKAIRGLGSDLAWWNSCSQAGIGLAMKVLEALAQGMGGLENAGTGHGRTGHWEEADLSDEESELGQRWVDDGDVQGLVVVEDFMLRPNEQGIGGRNVLVPVAITSAFLALWQQLSAVQVLISSTGGKSLMGNDKIKRWFPQGEGKGWVGQGMPHGTDALRHALLGVRRSR